VADLDDALTRYLPALKAFVRLRVGRAFDPRESVDDVVQSVCREALTGREQFAWRDENCFKSWLFTTAFRKIVAKLRHHHAQRRDRRREEPVADGDDPDAPSLLDCYATFRTPSQDLAAREQVAAVERAFAGLSEPQREVITLAKVAGLPHDEIAAAMGITPAASRQLLRRGLLRLAAALEEPARDGGTSRE
jgi:RNA polymerase sigma-70 factor (subfamily 1)